MSDTALNMANGQLITNSIHDGRILEAMTAVPRGACVPPALSDAAYVDDELPLGDGRFLMAPLPFARLLMLANIKPGERVLDVGCAYGYSAAVLSHLAGEVIACESDRKMAEAARRNLAAFGAGNVRVVEVASLADGVSADAPYDVIVLEGAIAAAPAALLRLLAEGGRLVAVERRGGRTPPGMRAGLSRLVEYANINGEIFHKEGIAASVPVLPGFESKPVFQF